MKVVMQQQMKGADIVVMRHKIVEVNEFMTRLTFRSQLKDAILRGFDVVKPIMAHHHIAALTQQLRDGEKVLHLRRIQGSRQHQTDRLMLRVVSLQRNRTFCSNTSGAAVSYTHLGIGPVKLACRRLHGH